jgi:hypothetical protein
MKTKFFIMMEILLCLNTAALSSMVIHCYCNDNEESIRTESGIFNEDYLFLGNELRFYGEAEDLVFLGKRLNFDGKTKLGLIAIGEKVIYTGKSGNGVIAAGMNIIIDGLITGNNYIACKSFTMNPSSAINGNLFIASAKTIIDGTLNGDLYAGTGELLINNEIHGNVTAYTGRITFGKNGKISGNLKYSANEKINEKDLSKISGTVTIDEKRKKEKERWNSFVNFMHSIGIFITIGLFLSFVVIGLLLLFLPVFQKLDAKQSERSFWMTALWGLIPVLMYPAVVILCFIFVITIPFALVLMLAFVPLLFIANIIGTTLTGKYLVTKFRWNVEKRHYQFLIGAAAGFILSLIPFINCLSFIFFFALGFGAYLSFLFNKNLSVTE